MGQPGPWLGSGRARGRDYDAQLQARLAGQNPHGEADFLEDLARRRLRLAEGQAVRVLDAGCGTGRVGIELARRGWQVLGVDLDPLMLEVARAKAPDIPWQVADLAQLRLDRTFDLAVLAGNVMIFVTRGQEPAVLRSVAQHLVPGGLLIAGFQIQQGGLTLAEYDAAGADAGLELVERWATWQRDPAVLAGDYAVSVHQLSNAASGTSHAAD